MKIRDGGANEFNSKSIVCLSFSIVRSPQVDQIGKLTEFVSVTPLILLNFSKEGQGMLKDVCEDPEAFF
ncbi:hypothetical protein L2E82_20438 [Cichorium intybus]|uniref:Uncharacterized protein n=1 Tax=Cichorium intybus TaxID=13427 RepID=A0ACB9DTD5_CICIN|nr:hypothetical protein L2E82_20438 [Cichorium intybus]